MCANSSTAYSAAGLAIPTHEQKGFSETNMRQVSANCKLSWSVAEQVILAVTQIRSRTITG